MSEMSDLHQIQKRTMQLLNFEDGLWDLLLGSMFLFLALYPVTRERLGPEWNLVLFLGVLALLVVGQLLIRRFVSTPRIGYALPRQSPKRRMLLIFTAVMVLITFALVLITLLSPGSDTTANTISEVSSGRGYLVEFIVLLVLGGIFSSIGYIFGVTRAYFYGWMIGLAYLASVYMSHTAGWVFHIPMAIAAGIIMLVGFLLLIRFLQTYPLRTEGA
jgi:hypothetical protein